MLKKRPKSLDSQFLIRIIRNEASPEEKEYFLAWLAESNQNKEEFGNLVLLWDMADQSQVSQVPDPNYQWGKIDKHISTKLIEEQKKSPAVQSDSNKKTPQATSHNRKQDFAWLYRAAAIIVISVGLTFLVKWNDQEVQPPTTKIVESANPAFYELITQKGERKTFPLGDGTIVYLNSGSKLIYPKVFSESSREVELVGEAYFSVMPDKERPFIVKSGKMNTEVTGTEFNVRYRNKKVNIVVAKGSVKTFLESSNESIDLTKGQMVSYSESRGFSSPVKANLNHYLAWRNNQFSFEHSPLKEVMDEIERYYNLDIIYKDETVKNKLLTGVFAADSLDQILSVISLTLDVTIEYKGSKVTIK
jgi:ferric-dicitrate binding protein FerR (iron transport regulator)